MLAFLVIAKLPYDTYDTKYQRQGKEYIVSLVFLYGLGQFVLVAQTYVVNEWYACYPVAVLLLAIIVLYVVLAANKVPEEIAPVHVVHLIVDEETHVVKLCRHFYLGRLALLLSYVGEFCTFGVPYVLANPSLVLAGVVTAVHAGEEHVLYVFVLPVVVNDLILVGVRRVFLLHAHVNGARLNRHGVAILCPVNLGIEALAIEQWA